MGEVMGCGVRIIRVLVRKGRGRSSLLSLHLVRTQGVGGKEASLWHRLRQLAPCSRIPHPPEQLDVDGCGINHSVCGILLYSAKLAKAHSD